MTTALFNAVARLARELSWQGTRRQYGLNWKSVAVIVKRAVEYGLRQRVRPPVHVIGIDEVSRRKGQVYLTVVYDLERRVLLWVGDDRTEEAVELFFTQEMGTRCWRRNKTAPLWPVLVLPKPAASADGHTSTRAAGKQCRQP